MKEKAGYYISNMLTAIVNLRELSATLYAVYKPGARNKLNIQITVTDYKLRLFLESCLFMKFWMN